MNDPSSPPSGLDGRIWAEVHLIDTGNLFKGDKIICQLDHVDTAGSFECEGVG